MAPLRGQLLQHLLLICLGLQVEKADGGGGLTAEGLAAERGGQGLPVLDVVGVVALKLAVRPKRLEVGNSPCEQSLLRTLSQLDGPLQSASQRRA
jgi:hypothetical protein